MKSNFILTTDTSCDVFRKELDSALIPWLPLSFTINGVSNEDTFTTNEEYVDFYKKIKDGAMPTTSQINVYNHEEFFKAQVEKGAKEIVHLTLSGGLSSTNGSAKIAAENVMNSFGDVNIFIVDTLSATLGHRYILDAAKALRDSKVSGKDAAKELESLASRLHHWVIVDDLMHLKRGGRVSGASAYIGSLLKVKPILVINNEGKLAVVKKAMGTSKAFSAIMDEAKARIINPQKPKFYIAQADAAEKADALEKLILEQYPLAEITKGWIGPVIGSHTGCGTIGLVYEGDKRLTNK